MNESKLYPLAILIFIMLIGLILAFADYIDGNMQIAQVKAHQERLPSHFLARQNDYYAKAIVLLNDDDDNAFNTHSIIC